MELSDQQLLTDWFIRKDAHAFQAIVQRHATMVFHTALRILRNPADAEDTTQQCFETLITTQKAEHIDSLGAWLHGMATKISLKHIRSTSRRSEREKNYIEATDATNDTQEWQEIYPIIDEAIQYLHEKYRAPVIAHFLEGQTHAAIAKDLNVSRSTITSRINQGIRQIEASLKKKGVLTTLALAPTLTTQLANAAPIQPALIANLGKLALTQGQGVATTASTAAVAITWKWIAACLIIAGAATATTWLSTNDKTATLPIATIPVEMPVDPLQSPTPTETDADTQPAPELIPVTAVDEPTADVQSTTETLSQPNQPLANVIHVSGIVQDAAGVPAQGAVVNAAWVSGETQVFTDELGRFSIPLHKNTFNEDELILVRKVTYEGNLYDVPIRAEVHGDQLIGYVDSRLGQFPVTGTRTTDGEGAFGTWDVLITYDNQDYPGQFTLNQSPDGNLYASWIDELGPTTLTRLEVPEEIHLSATVANRKAFRQDFEVPLEGRDDITLTLVSPATLFGQIIASDGTPLPDWNISFQNDEDSNHAKSDRKGNFIVADINPGDYFYSAYDKTGKRIMESDTITLDDGQELRDFTLVYDLGQPVTGYVTDTSNQPIESVWISATPSALTRDRSGVATNYTARTDANGAYELVGIPNFPGTRIDFRLNHEDYMYESSPDILLDGTPKNFALLRRPTITGRVVNADTNVPITQYRMYPMNGSSKMETVLLNASAEFQLTNHDDGVFTTHTRGYNDVGIVVSAPGYATKHHRFTRVRPGENRTNVTIAMEPIDPIDGIVVDTDNKPIGGAYIYLGQPPMIIAPHKTSNRGEASIARANQEGEFTITEYAPNFLDRIAAHADGYAPAWADISSTLESITITLRKGGHLEGTVTHMGVPVAKAQSDILLAVNDEPIMHDSTDKKGGYSFDSVPELPIMLQAVFVHDGQRMIISRRLPIQTSDTHQDDIDFITNGTAFLDGTLLLDDQPPRNAYIYATTVLQNGGELLYHTEVTDNGTFAIGPVPAGAYEIEPNLVQRDDGTYLESSYETITLQADQTTHHNINLTTN